MKIWQYKMLNEKRNRSKLYSKKLHDYKGWRGEQIK